MPALSSSTSDEYRQLIKELDAALVRLGTGVGWRAGDVDAVEGRILAVGDPIIPYIIEHLPSTNDDGAEWFYVLWRLTHSDIRWHVGSHSQMVRRWQDWSLRHAYIAGVEVTPDTIQGIAWRAQK